MSLCSPCKSPTRCCSSHCMENLDRCCCYMFGSGNYCYPPCSPCSPCSPCCSCSRIACCPSMSCCIPFPCRPCRPKHIWDIRAVVPTGPAREVCCPPRPPRKASKESRTARRRRGADEEDCPACIAGTHSKRSHWGGGESGTKSNLGSTQTSTPTKLSSSSHSLKSGPASRQKVAARSEPKTPNTAQGLAIGPQDSGKASTATSLATPISAVSSSHSLSHPQTLHPHSEPPAAATATGAAAASGAAAAMGPRADTRGSRAAASQSPGRASDAVSDGVAIERRNLPVTVCMEISTQTDLLKLPFAKETPPASAPIPQSNPISTPIPSLLGTPNPSITSTPLLHTIIPPRNARPPMGYAPPIPPVNPYSLPFVCMPFPMNLGIPKDATGCPLCGGKTQCTESCHKILLSRGESEAQKCIRSQQARDQQPEKPFFDKRASMGDQSSIFTDMTSYSSTEERHKGNINSVFFIRRETASAGRDACTMAERKIDSATQGAPSTPKSLRHRSRYKRQDRGDSDPMHWQSRSPSLRSISSQTSADVRKYFAPDMTGQLGLLGRPSLRKTSNRPSRRSTKVAAASQTWPSQLDFGSQTPTTEEEAGKKFAPQNVFFVATPNVTDAWCRAVCGDSVAELPKILEKFTAVQNKSETSVKSMDGKSSRGRGSEKRFAKVNEMVNESPTHPSEGEVGDESLRGEERDREKEAAVAAVAAAMSTSSKRDKFRRKSSPQPPLAKGVAGSGTPVSPAAASVTPAGMLKRSDVLKMSHAEMTKREMIACLLGRTEESKGKATGNAFHRSSTSKISESGSTSDMKTFPRPSRASSLQRPCISKQQSIIDVSKKEKSNSISGMSDVVMAGPGLGVEKGVCANLRSKMEIQAKLANVLNRDRGSQYGSNTITSGAARTVINKIARRLTPTSHVPTYVNRRITYSRNVTNPTSSPTTSTKINRLSETKPSLSPTNRANLNEQMKLLENNGTEEEDLMDWRDAMAALSVTRVSVKPRHQGNDVIDEGETPGDVDCQDLYPNDDPQDPAYDVCEVEVRANSLVAESDDPLPDEEEMYEEAGDQESPSPFLTSRREISPSNNKQSKAPARERTFSQKRGYKRASQLRGSSVGGKVYQTRPQLINPETEVSQRIPPRKQSRDAKRVVSPRSPGLPTQLEQSDPETNYVLPSRSVHPPHRRVSPTETRTRTSENKNKNQKRGSMEAIDSPSQSLSAPNRSLESRVEIEDVGADESEDESHPPPNWSLQQQPPPPPLKSREKSMQSCESRQSKRSHNSHHSHHHHHHHRLQQQQQQQQQPPLKSSNKCPSPARDVSNANHRKGAVVEEEESAELLRPTSASMPSNMEELLRERGRGREEIVDERRGRPDYHSSPAHYGLKESKSTVGTQARRHHSHERRRCGSSQQYALLTIPQAEYPSKHASKPRDHSPKMKRSIDLRNLYDKGKENSSHHVLWNCSRKGSNTSHRSRYSEEDMGHHCSTSRKPRFKDDIDYGPEVLVDSRNYLHHVPMVRSRGERSYTDAGEIVLPKQRKCLWNECCKGRARKDECHGEKKQKDFYYEFGPQSHVCDKKHHWPWCRKWSPDRDRSPDNRECRDYTRNKSTRKSRPDELLYELGDYTGESEAECHRKWKHSQLSLPKQRHIKATKSSRVYAYSPSKRRIISTPVTPLTSSAHSPHYRHHYRRRSSGRELNHHGGQRGRKRSASKWD